jgi:Outer membrane protein beta-barrel family/CarboxypepD_reg-like domain/TonB-dependent Receptor Plug Domain
MKLLYSIIVLFFAQIIYSQNAVETIPITKAPTSIIKGTTIEESNGKPLAGVIVFVKTTKFSTVSEQDGTFILRNIPVGKYDLQFSFVSFKTKIISDVETNKDEPTTLTVSLEENNNQLDEVVVKKTKMKTESLKSLLTLQKNSVRVSDGISAESIKRTPDKTTSDVLKRISGASIQDNKFVIIRGLNDRYNASLINGASLPSSEPDRKAFSFDIFPSNMIDNLIISKTATPDLPGDFAGGVIQITTRNTPDKNFQTLSIGSSYNTITTGKDQVYYEGGKTDWLGLDDGTRALPKSLPDFQTLQNIDDKIERAEYAKSLDSDWNLYNKKFSPNINFQYSIGRRIDIGKSVLGILVSLSNSKTNNYNETARKDFTASDIGKPSLLYGDLFDKNYSEQFLTGALANFSLKLNENNSISFKNLFSINSEDKVILRTGAVTNASDVNPLKTRSDVRWFTSNKIYSEQITGEHFFPKSKFRINWVSSFSSVQREIPNLRRNIYNGYDEITDPSDPNPNDLIYKANIADNNGGPDFGGGIFFSENKEKIYNTKIDFTNKLGESSNHELKYGLFTQNREREFFARQLHYNVLNQGDVIFDSSLLEQNTGAIFNPKNIGVIAPNVGGFTIFDSTKYFDAYKASADLHAAYFMVDNKIKNFRLVWGVRAENYYQNLMAKESETKDLVVNNLQLDFLPSLNVIYSVNSKQNLRLSYSKTLNRPEFRELAPFGFYDFTTQFFTQGTPELQIAKIQNADFRYEIYPGKSQLFSISAFYKKFDNPIEIVAGVNNKEVKYLNAKSAVNYGFELDFRTLIGSLFDKEDSVFLNNLTVFSNLSIIKSKVDVSNLSKVEAEVKSRPMQGQSPYVFNAGLQYLDAESGYSFSGNINRTGNRIAVVGNIQGDPTLWEKSRTFLDIQVAKTFLKKKLEIKINAQNILAQDLIFYQNNDLDPTEVKGLDGFFNNVFNGDKQNKNGFNEKEDDLVWQTKFGRTFSLTATYNF